MKGAYREMARSACAALLMLSGSGCDALYRVRGSVFSKHHPAAGVIVQLVRECDQTHYIGERSVIAVSKSDGQFELEWVGPWHSRSTRFIVEFWRDGFESECVEVSESDWTRCFDGSFCYPVYAELSDSK